MTAEASDDEPPALRVRYADAAEADLEAVYNALLTRSLAVAEQWLAGLQDAITERAGDHAALPGTRYVAADADHFPGREIHALLYRPARGRRGSPAWRVLYELLDEDGDGAVDTFVVAYIRRY